MTHARKSQSSDRVGRIPMYHRSEESAHQHVATITLVSETSGEVVVQYALTEQEYVDGFRPWLAQDSGRRIKKLLMCAMAMALLGLPWLVFNPLMSAIVFTLSGVLFVGAATIRYTSFIQLQRFWSRSESLQETMTVRIGRESIEASNSTGMTEFRWDAVTRVLFARDSYVLMSQLSLPLLILPRRAIVSDEDHQLLRSLLSSHVSTVNINDAIS
jgi:hypothetical protein